MTTSTEFTLPTSPIEVLRATILVGVVLIRSLTFDVVLIVHTLGPALSLMLRLLAIEPVFALGLGELVNLGSRLGPLCYHILMLS